MLPSVLVKSDSLIVSFPGLCILHRTPGVHWYSRTISDLSYHPVPTLHRPLLRPFQLTPVKPLFGLTVCYVRPISGTLSPLGRFEDSFYHLYQYKRKILLARPVTYLRSDPSDPCRRLIVSYRTDPPVLYHSGVDPVVIASLFSSVFVRPTVSGETAPETSRTTRLW